MPHGIMEQCRHISMYLFVMNFLMNITYSENEALKIFVMTATFVSHVLHSRISIPLNDAVSKNLSVYSCVKKYHHLQPQI